MQLLSGRREQAPSKDRPLTGPRFIVSVARRPGVSCDHSPNSATCECRCSGTWLQKAHCNTRAAGVLDTCSATVDACPGAWSMGLTPLRWMICSAGKASVLWLRGKPYGEIPGLYKVERNQGDSCKDGAPACPNERRHWPPCPSENSAGRALFQADGPVRKVKSRRPRGVSSRPPPLHTKSNSLSSAGHGAKISLK